MEATSHGTSIQIYQKYFIYRFYLQLKCVTALQSYMYQTQDLRFVYV